MAIVITAHACARSPCAGGRDAGLVGVLRGLTSGRGRDDDRLHLPVAELSGVEEHECECDASRERMFEHRGALLSASA